MACFSLAIQTFNSDSYLFNIGYFYRFPKIKKD
jgi:hypothetical protein